MFKWPRGNKSGQAPGKTPARVEAGGGQLLNGHRAPAEGQLPAGTMAEKVTGRSSHPSTNWLTRTNTFVPIGGTPYRAAMLEDKLQSEPVKAAAR